MARKQPEDLRSHRWYRATDLRSEPCRVDTPVDPALPSPPRYLIWFGIPPFLMAFVIASLDPMAGLALLACLATMVIALSVLFRLERKHAVLRDRVDVPVPPRPASKTYPR
jgi:hypothetical protein